MRILIALDRSEVSQQAFDSVIQRQWPKNAAFKLVSVVEPFNPVEASAEISSEFWSVACEQVQASRNADAESMLQSAVSRLLRANPEADVRTHLCQGFMADEIIVDVAREWQADLVILGSHSRRGLDRLLLGSVSNAVLQNSPCSVEIVKPQRLSSGGLSNVLIALDGSRFSEAALKAVLDRPWKESTKFKVITVIKSALDACLGVENSLAVLGMLEDEQQTLQRAKAELSDKAGLLTSRYGANRVQIEVLVGEPRDTILKVIEDWPAHLAIVGSHGRTALGRLFLGSVSQAVALHGACSVEVVKLPVSIVRDKEPVSSGVASVS